MLFCLQHAAVVCHAMSASMLCVSHYSTPCLFLLLCPQMQHATAAYRKAATARRDNMPCAQRRFPDFKPGKV